VEYGLARLKPDQRGRRDYLLAGFLQPHWQLFTWQRHAFFWHAQEQASQSQLPQQLDLVRAFEVVFVKSDIVVLPNVFFAPHALSKGLTYTCQKPYSPVSGRGSLAR